MRGAKHPEQSKVIDMLLANREMQAFLAGRNAQFYFVSLLCSKLMFRIALEEARWRDSKQTSGAGKLDALNIMNFPFLPNLVLFIIEQSSLSWTINIDHIKKQCLLVFSLFSVFPLMVFGL